MKRDGNKSLRGEMRAMGDWVKLKADDGHELGAYVAVPAREPVGALVVVQEIFGVNKSIRAVADHYASEGILRSHRRCSTALSAIWNWATARPT